MVPPAQPPDAPAPSSHLLFALAALLCSFVILFSNPSGTDYLYYYLPAAEYLLLHHHFPPKLLPSLVDAPLAYPPAEFFLLLLALKLESFAALGVKALMVARVSLFFYLLHQLTRQGARAQVLMLFALLPSALMLLFLYNTDLSVLLALLSMALYLHDRRFAVLTSVLVAYALLSKYTFAPLYALSLLYFALRAPRKLPLLLAPLALYLPFLWKNYSLYANPLYPLASDLFLRLEPWKQELLEGWTQIAFDRAWLWRCLRGMSGTLLAAALLLPLGRDRLLTGLVAVYVGIWALAMNPGNAGDSVRFLLPAALVLVIALARSDVSWGGLALMVTLHMPLHMLSMPELQLRLYAGTLCLMALICWRMSAVRQQSVAVLALLSVCALRLSAKHSFDFQDLGYSVYQAPLAALEARLKAGERVLTDFRPLPLELRMHPGLIYEDSTLGGDAYLTVREAGAPIGVDTLFLATASLRQKPYYSNRFEYEGAGEVAGYGWWKVRPTGQVQEVHPPMGQP